MKISSYPKWKYHAERPARVVETADAEQSLGDEWKDSPADFGVITCPSIDQMYAIEDTAYEKHAAVHGKGKK